MPAILREPGIPPTSLVAGTQHMLIGDYVVKLFHNRTNRRLRVEGYFSPAAISSNHQVPSIEFRSSKCSVVKIRRSHPY
jgi:hypothetical protein